MNKEELAFNKGYRITRDGNCISPKGKQLKLVATNHYYRFSIKNSDKVITVKVHRMQAYQKFGDRIYDDTLVVRHLNGDYLDNSWNNIELGTDSENMLDVPKEARSAKSRKAHVIYSEEMIADIRRYKETHTYKETMSQFNISSSGTLHYLLNNR